MKREWSTMAKESMTREPRIIYRFKRRKQFEFWFQWLIGAQTHGTSEASECFQAVSQMSNGDLAGWHDGWGEMAQRVKVRAEGAHASGHKVSAREAYLRAYTYYRAPLIFMSPTSDPRYLSQLKQARSCFRAAAALFDTPFEVLEIPFEGRKLPGYFLAPDRSRARRRSLIMIGGGDTFVEDLYAYVGPAALKRGYNALLVDLPGQGDLPFEGLMMRPDAEVPMRAVVDYALGRAEIDPEKLAAFGVSGGGYLVPRAVTREKRLRACIACSLILEMNGIWGEKLARAETSPVYRAILKLPLSPIKSALALLDVYKWRWGVKTLAELYDACKAFKLDPREIACPFLNVVTQQEWEIVGPTKRWAQACEKEAPHPGNRLVITPRNEGADSHALGTNLSLMGQVVFDWLDEVFDRVAIPAVKEALR
jgi:hypothetical protein